MTENNLIPVDISPVSLFQKDKLEPFLAKIKRAVDDFVSDVETAKGRKEVAAFAYKIAQTGVLVDKAGKNLNEERRAKINLVNKDRRRAKGFLKEQKDRARQPLTDYEDAEKKAIAKEAAQMEFEADHTEALEFHALYLKEKELEALKEKIAMEAEIKAEKEEVERIKKEEIKREERIKREAVAATKREAEEAIAAEKERVIRLEVEAKAEKERVEQAKKDATEKAEREKKEAVENARQKAEEKAAKIEVERIDKENEERVKKGADLLAANKKAAHYKHRKKVEGEAIGGFMNAVNCTEADAEKLVAAIKNNEIKNVTINY